MPESVTVNIPFVLGLLSKWKKRILIFLCILTIFSAIALFLTPNRYYSYTSAIPTNAQLTDKAALYSDQLDNLYQSLGNWSDLDRLHATCELDTSYRYLVNRFQLVSHYKVSESDPERALQQALKQLRDENCKTEKTETGLLRIHIWDQHPDTAARMANAFMNYVEEVNRRLQLRRNEELMEKIQSSLLEKSATYRLLSDSAASLTTAADKTLADIKLKSLLEGITQLEKIADQTAMTLKAQQPSLIVIDRATPNRKHESPKRLFSLITIMVSGLLFSIFLITLLESFQLYQRGRSNNQ